MGGGGGGIGGGADTFGGIGGGADTLGGITGGGADTLGGVATTGRALTTGGGREIGEDSIMGFSVITLVYILFCSKHLKINSTSKPSDSE